MALGNTTNQNQTASCHKAPYADGRSLDFLENRLGALVEYAWQVANRAHSMHADLTGALVEPVPIDHDFGNPSRIDRMIDYVDAAMSTLAHCDDRITGVRDRLFDAAIPVAPSGNLTKAPR